MYRKIKRPTQPSNPSIDSLASMMRINQAAFALLISTTSRSALAFTSSPKAVPGVLTSSFKQQYLGSPLSRSLHTSPVILMARKAGVSSPEELRDFVEKAGDRLLVVDTRNPDAEVEPGDQKSFAVSGIPSDGHRPQAVSLIWDRSTSSMPLPEGVDKDTPIITHCGGGGRGQLAKDFLEENGYTQVLNGGGPKETECWAEFGNK